jgi:hypothetical protein
VEENVNVLVRAIGVPTPTPTPCLFPSPACTAFVCGPRVRPFVEREFAVLSVLELVDGEVVVSREDVVFMVLPL